MIGAKLKIAVLYDVWEDEEPTPEPAAEEKPAKKKKRKAPRHEKREKEDREEIFEALEKLGHQPFYQVLDGTTQSLAGLPPAYLDVGLVETFRDEVVDYASRLARASVSTELHVWSGAFRGFDVIAANSALARAARAARIDYLRRRLRSRR